jgi:hypothetical protein
MCFRSIFFSTINFRPSFHTINRIRLAVFAFAIMGFTMMGAVGSASAASCTLKSFTGVYGFYATGYDGSDPFSSVGQITSNADGSVTGTLTHSVDGSIGAFSFTGTYTMAKSCTGTLTLSVDGVTEDFNMVLDDSNKNFQLIRSDSGFIVNGSAIPLGTATCGLSGKSVNYGMNVYGGVDNKGITYVGQVTLNGKGAVTGTITISFAGTITSGVAVTGTYTQNANCTGTMQITPAGFSTINFTTVALDSDKELLLIETDSGTVVGGEID